MVGKCSLEKQVMGGRQVKVSRQAVKEKWEPLGPRQNRNSGAHVAMGQISAKLKARFSLTWMAQ